MSPGQLQRLYLQIILTQCISLKQGGGGFVSVWVLRCRDRYKKVLPFPKVGKYFSNIVLYNFVTIKKDNNDTTYICSQSPKSIKKNTSPFVMGIMSHERGEKILLLNTS